MRFLTGVSVSYNQGADWRILLPTAGPVAPTHQASLDPYFYLDPDTDRIFADRFVTVRHGRYVVPVRAEARTRVRGPRGSPRRPGGSR